MKLYFIKWKKAVCLSITTILLLIAAKDHFYDITANPPQLCHAAGNDKFREAAPISDKDAKIIIYSCYLNITCSTKNMMLTGYFNATTEPTGAEIYRAKIKPNGKNGKFKKIGKCKDFRNDTRYDETDFWVFHYTDHAVKAGNKYAYKYKVYCGAKGKTNQYRECYSIIKQGVAAKTTGKYTCTIIKNTAKKLVVKLTGKSKKNGLLESYYPIPNYRGDDVELRCKNDGEDEIKREWKLIKYSYNGKKWDTGTFAIKGKQSLYLYFEYTPSIYAEPGENNINLSNYQHVQMFVYYARYNLQPSTPGLSKYECQQIRLNLSSGTAAAGNFISHNEQGQLAFVWDGDIFARDYEILD